MALDRLALDDVIAGPPQAGISVHLASLKESGLIAGRLQGRAVYYRLARPELGYMLRAPRGCSPQQGTESGYATSATTSL